MSGEIKLFRRELGGFSRYDVIEYIRKLAGERNKYLDAQQSAEAEIERLGAAIEVLKAELEESNRLIKEVRVDALNDARQAIGELSSSFNDVSSDIEATTNHIRSELLKAADTVSLMMQILERAGRRLSELGVVIDSEKALADAELEALSPPLPEPIIKSDPEAVLSELKLTPRAAYPDPEEEESEKAE